MLIFFICNSWIVATRYTATHFANCFIVVITALWLSFPVTANFSSCIFCFSVCIIVLSGAASEIKERFRVSKTNLTHLCLASHKRDIGKQCRNSSDATECGVWAVSTLFALITGISMKYGFNQNKPDTPSAVNVPVRRLKVEESSRHKRVNISPSSFPTDRSQVFSLLQFFFHCACVVSNVAFVLSLFVPHLSFLSCLGRTVLDVYDISRLSSLIFSLFSYISLRKHAYSNIWKISPQKLKIFR